MTIATAAATQGSSPAMTPADQRRARAMIQGSDCFRRTPSRFAEPVAYKEWQHFLLHCPPSLERQPDGAEPPLKLIVNFNLIDNQWATPDEPREVARVIVLAKRTQWTGVTEPIDARDVVVEAGQISAQFGDSSLRWDGQQYLVRVDLPEHQIDIDLAFDPQTLPGLAINQPLAPSLRLSWLFVPRLLASGSVSVAGQTVEVDRALAYHDHNWSVFRWGDDFTWEWASILPQSPDCPWTFVLMRLTDRRRTTVRSQAVFVWFNANKARTFRDREITVRTEGCLAVVDPFQTPAVMRLLTTGQTVDVPQRWRLDAGGKADGDHLTVQFEPRALSQVVMPSETELEGVTILNEATGAVSAHGTIGGRAIDFSGHGVFEFLR